MRIIATCILYLFTFIFTGISLQSRAQASANFSYKPHWYTSNEVKNTADIFDSLHLGKHGLGRVIFDYAMIGYSNLKAKGMLGNNQLLSIIDFSLPSSKKRLYVLDMKNYRLLFHTYAAHGRNSGTVNTLYFSNEPESFKSSVGFYITAGTYDGKHGYSLKLKGYEAGFNDNAEERAIVMHSADYVSEALIKQQGYIGRSLGCPALAPEVYKDVIQKIQNKSCLFMYGNYGQYIENSKLLKQKIKLNNP